MTWQDLEAKVKEKYEHKDDEPVPGVRAITLTNLNSEIIDIIEEQDDLKTQINVLQNNLFTVISCFCPYTSNVNQFVNCWYTCHNRMYFIHFC